MLGRVSLLVLLLSPACRAEGPGQPEHGTGLAALGLYPDLDRDLRAYGLGRAAEIGALEQWLSKQEARPAAALDSVGAAAAELDRARYVRLANEVDRALIRWREEGKLDQRLFRLDSLRVERTVLLVRLTAQAMEGQW